MLAHPMSFACLPDRDLSEVNHVAIGHKDPPLHANKIKQITMSQIMSGGGGTCFFRGSRILSRANCLLPFSAT